MKDIAYRVIADHIRCLTFAITDGACPATRAAATCCAASSAAPCATAGSTWTCTSRSCATWSATLVEQMGDAFPELARPPRQATSSTSPRSSATKRRRFTRRSTAASSCLLKPPNTPPPITMAASRGDDAFKLHDTYGFPIDLTELMAEEQRPHRRHRRIRAADGSSASKRPRRSVPIRRSYWSIVPTTAQRNSSGYSATRPRRRMLLILASFRRLTRRNGLLSS